MEALPDLSLLKFRDNTLEFVRKDVNLDHPGRMKEAVNILEDWVKKQSHFMKKDFSRSYLEKTIVTSKGLLERAKVRLEKYCTFRTTMPEYFRHDNFEESYSILTKFVTHCHVPKMTPEHYRIHITKMFSVDGDSSLLFRLYQYIISVSEYVKENDYPAGFVLVLDLTDISIMGLVSKVNVAELHQALSILMDGFGMRTKAIHIITASKMVDSLFAIAKAILSEKIVKRIHVHKTLDGFYEHVDRDSLPVEYGGKERSMKELQDDMYKIMVSEEFQSYLKELDKAKINESYRQTIKFSQDDIGITGSFRALVVD